jgi:uncharacterized protein
MATPGYAPRMWVTPVPFSAYLISTYIRVPTFVMVGRNDEMVHFNRDVTKATYDLMRCPKQWVNIDGGHFGPVRTNANSFSKH